MENQSEILEDKKQYIRVLILAIDLFIFGILLSKIYIENGFFVSNDGLWSASHLIDPIMFFNDHFISFIIPFAVASITIAALFIKKTFKYAIYFAFIEIVFAGLIFMPISFWDGYVPVTIIMLGYFMWLTIFITLPLLAVTSVLHLLYNKYLRLEQIVFLVTLSILPLITGLYYFQITTCNLGTNKNCIILKEMQKLNVSACLKPTEIEDRDDCYSAMAILTNSRELCANLDNKYTYNYDIFGQCIKQTDGNLDANDKIFKKIEEILSCKNNYWMKNFNRLAGTNPLYDHNYKDITCRIYESDLSMCFVKKEKSEVVSCLNNKFGEEPISQGKVKVDFLPWIKILQRTISS